jgi:hypothetical protein
MPYKTEWADRDVFLTHQGVTVYHAYDDGDFDDRLLYHFSVAQDEEGGGEFDVRDLPTFRGVSENSSELDVTEAIQQAIEQGILEQGTVRVPTGA